MFFFNNQNLNLKEIENDCFYRNDIDKIKKKIVILNNEKFSFYHLCKSYILFKNQYNVNLILSFDVKKSLTFFNYFLKIYYIKDDTIDKCNQRYCISFLCNNDYHYDLKKSKLIYSLKKSTPSELMQEFPILVQDFKLCYECNTVWNYHSEIRYIEDKKKYDHDKCDSCKIKIYIESKSLELIGKCVICLDDVYKNDCIKTLCKHTFHNECLKKWKKDNNKCPLCRTILHNENNNNEENFILTI